MQYYIKIYNQNTGGLVGYYKETGLNRITRLPKGMKYFNTVEEAMINVLSIDNGFIRDKDGKYYTSHAIIYGDNTRQPTKSIYRDNRMEGDDYKDELEAFIRQNSPRNSR